ncbi:hypothetical protein [Pseudomonas allokribbensis]|uniref:hypothetical protein n=1 Tax=Pseudomonas allokribbensis TaxID=2774460 RepID=UPI0017880FAB|nr:hypothetical protein [Pseudomonas allokribbensis]
MSINVNSTQISALLQLYPMAIPGAVENLQPPGAYHLGIPESIHSPSTKLFMVIDPVTLFSTPFAAGDSVKLWVNSQATSVIKPIKPGEENDRFFMELPWGVLKDGLNTLYYEVTRVSGNKDQSTPTLNVLFNNPVSGITVSHPASIGPGQTGPITITISYPRPFGTVTLTIGNWSITLTNFDHTKPILYPLTVTDLQQIGDGNHPVSATVVDQLTNSNMSATSFIDIRANQQQELVIDKTPMHMDTPVYKNSYGWATKVVTEAPQRRIPIAGQAPFQYRSANVLVAQVDASGTVTSGQTGSTLITVTAANGKSDSYPVEVSNKYQLLVNKSSMSPAQALAWIRSVGGLVDTAVSNLAALDLVNPLPDLFDNVAGRSVACCNFDIPSLNSIQILLWETGGSYPYIGATTIPLTSADKVRALTIVPR